MGAYQGSGADAASRAVSLGLGFRFRVLGFLGLRVLAFKV